MHPSDPGYDARSKGPTGNGIGAGSGSVISTEATGNKAVFPVQGLTFGKLSVGYKYIHHSLPAFCPFVPVECQYINLASSSGLATGDGPAVELDGGVGGVLVGVGAGDIETGPPGWNGIKVIEAVAEDEAGGVLLDKIILVLSGVVGSNNDEVICVLVDETVDELESGSVGDEDVVGGVGDVMLDTEVPPLIDDIEEPVGFVPVLKEDAGVFSPNKVAQSEGKRVGSVN